MPLKEDLTAKIAADREAGRDIPPVIEELFLMLGDFLEPEEAEKKPDPVVEEHVQEQPETENLVTAQTEQKPAEPIVQQ